jgi:pimeloyl-ACP methyl ester carboxylesterase
MQKAHHWYDFNALRPPGILKLVLEARLGWEYAATVAARPLLAMAPRGDGHPVLVLPGMLAGDLTTRPLRRYLKRQGYTPYAWEQGLNLGPREGVIEAMLERLKTIYLKHERPVSLIGWSLGGLYARELAKAHPEIVRSVITMGTPFTGHPKATNAWRVYQYVTGHKLDREDLHEPLRAPPPVPTTSIFSRTDGIVSWHCSLEHATEHSESIEVKASHLGMGMNPLTLYAIADRLAQPEHDWKPFDRSGVLACLYPNPYRR